LCWASKCAQHQLGTLEARQMVPLRSALTRCR
jgi:hypothetical protein